MADLDINQLTIVGLDLTIEEYKKSVLDGYQPYYERKQLCFECTQCGKCCDRPGDIYLTPSDIYRISAHLKMEVEPFKRTLCVKQGHEWVMKVTQKKACPFFQKDRCTIHAVKPIQCRTYPFWPEYVGDKDAWLDEAQECEGIGRGRAYSAEEVEALLVGIGAPD